MLNQPPVRLVPRNQSVLNSLDTSLPATCTRLKSLLVNFSWDQFPRSIENQPHGFVCLQNMASAWCSLACDLILTYCTKILSKNNRTMSCWFDFQLWSSLKDKWDESVLLLKQRKVPSTYFLHGTAQLAWESLLTCTQSKIIAPRNKSE